MIYNVDMCGTYGTLPNKLRYDICLLYFKIWYSKWHIIAQNIFVFLNLRFLLIWRWISFKNWTTLSTVYRNWSWHMLVVFVSAAQCYSVILHRRTHSLPPLRIWLPHSLISLLLGPHTRLNLGMTAKSFLCLYGELQPQRNPEGPHHRPQTPSTKNPNPITPIQEPNPKTPTPKPL